MEQFEGFEKLKKMVEKKMEWNGMIWRIRKVKKKIKKQNRMEQL